MLLRSLAQALLIVRHVFLTRHSGGVIELTLPFLLSVCCFPVLPYTVQVVCSLNMLVLLYVYTCAHMQTHTVHAGTVHMSDHMVTGE